MSIYRKYDRSVWFIQALRLFAIIACLWGSHTAFVQTNGQSPTWIVTLVLTIPQVIFFLRDVKWMKKQ